jgi:M6 family metalloprotease-like protein
MRTIHRCIVPLLALVAAPAIVLAQDVEVAAERAGLRLPEGYYSRLRSNPDFFQASGGWIARAGRAAAAAQPLSGDLPLVAVPALFSDSSDPEISADDLRQRLFDGPAEDGTLREYYAEVSGGRLNIAGGVAPWSQTSLKLTEVVGSEYGLGGDSRVGEFLVEALTSADVGTDFGLFDNDGTDNIPNSGDDDGVVDAIAFYFLEIAASCGGPGIWPHFSRISNWVGQAFETDDLRPDSTPVIIDPYFIQSIVNCDGTEIAPVTTIAHEAGHLLGLPDLYHRADGLLPEQRRWVVGCWSLMAAGAWGCGPVGDRTSWRRPTHLGAWEKLRLGWLNSVEQISDTEHRSIPLPPVQTTGEILEVPLSDAERLLIENRQQVGFDRDLPASGVLVYRINDTIPFKPCRECTPVYGVMLLEADNDSTLVRTDPEGGNRGEAGDAYGALGPGALTNLTEPSTRHNGGLGEESGVNIYRITQTQWFAWVVLSTAPISIPRLAGPLLLDAENSLSEPETEYLDQLNNRNGRYDVGDLRAYLQRTAGSRQP